MAVLSFSSCISSLSSSLPRFQFFAPKPKPVTIITMEKKKKKKPLMIKLVSSAGTGFFYVTEKSVKAQRNSYGSKLELLKYDPRVKRHVKFIEEKIKRK